MSYSRETMAAFSRTLADLHAADHSGILSPLGNSMREGLRFTEPLDADQVYLFELIEAHRRQLMNGRSRKSAHRQDNLAVEIASFSRLRQRGLTPRECDVVAWIAQGKHDAEIATILGCAPKTISKHVEHLLAKLDAETRLAAAHTALEWLNPDL